MSDRKNYNPRQRSNIQQETQQPSKEVVDKVDAKDLKEAIAKIESNPDIVETLRKTVKEHNQYLENVQPDSTPPETSPPVYNVSRDTQNGEVKIESKKNLVVKGQTTKSLLMQEMLINLEKEIQKQSIEIEIHESMDKTLLGKDPDRGINLRRIDSFKNNLEYLKMKKDHLLKLIEKG